VREGKTSSNVSREVSAAKYCNPASLSGSMLEITSLHIPMRQVLFGLVASSFVILLGFPGWACPKTDISGGRLNLVTTYSERRRNRFARCKKKSCEVLTVICLLALETFLPEYEYHYSLNANNKFALRQGLGPI
jgi:hypothetical protein